MAGNTDAVMKALADPTRRALLDRLYAEDGQSLGALAEGVVMTRFGVMKHLNVLESAGLITSRKAGRRKLHYLNPVPIVGVYERWVSKYAAPYLHTMTALKRTLEEGDMSDPVHIFELFIRTTPERLWDALTNPALTQQYFFSLSVEAEWSPGAKYVYRAPDGMAVLTGEIVEASPPSRLVTRGINAQDEEASKEPPSTVTWEIEQRGEICKLTLTHDLAGAPRTSELVKGGWPVILSSLKSMLETGAALVMEG